MADSQKRNLSFQRASRPLRVVVIVDHAEGVSGPHRHVVSCLNALGRRSDARVHLLCGHHDSEAPFAREANVDIRNGFRPIGPAHVLPNVLKAIQSTKRADVIYVPTGLRSFLYACLVKGRRKLVVGPNVTGIPLLMNMYNPGPLMTTKMSDAWIEMSEVRVEECVKGGTPRNRIHLVPHAVDSSLFSPARRRRDVWIEEDLDPTNLKVIHVGSMAIERKGIPVLIDAFRRIRRQIKSVDLVLVGPPGSQLEASKPLPEGVFPIGPRYGSRLAELLASADLFMGASRYETFWYTPLEAMASGLAVIVSRVGAVPSMIPRDGVQGKTPDIVDTSTWSYRSDAAERLACVACDLLQDEAARRVLGQRARAHVCSEFSESRLGERLMEVFFKVVSVSKTIERRVTV